MQWTGHIYDKRTGEKILVLVRQSKYGRHLKKRNTGKEGTHMADEEIYLNEAKQKLGDLKKGETIYC